MKKLLFQNAQWEATALPENGGNLIRLYYRPKNLEILRTPLTEQEFLEHPAIWGLPLLFPPNRTANGAFQYNGKIYTLPVNEPSCNNNLHGILLDSLWDGKCEENCLCLQMRHPADSTWPHEFAMELRYEFAENKVTQTLRTINTGNTPMPFMAGFHSAFQMPHGTTVEIPHPDWCYTMDPIRHLVTGARQPSPLPDGPFQGGEPPAISCHFSILPDKPYALFHYPQKGIKMEYRLGCGWQTWMCWNCKGEKHFFCAEPMTCLVNAANLKDSIANTGFRELQPQEEALLTASWTIGLCPL